MQDNKVYRVEVSAKTIVFIVFFLIFLLLMWMIRDLLLTLFVAFIITSAAKPPVAWLEKKRIPRKLAVVFVFLLFITTISFLFFWVVPPLIGETTLLIKHMPSIISGIHPSVGTYINIDTLAQYIPNLTNQVFLVIKSLFSNIMFLVTTIFFSVYLTMDRNFVKNILFQFFDDSEAVKIERIISTTEKRLGAWLLGELVLMFVVGFMTFIGLTFFGVKYALPLSIIAGMLEVIPNIGPTIATIPVFIIGVGQSYFLGFCLIGLYIIVQQLENHLIVPFIMKKVTGLNPIITLIALIIGGRLFGIL